MLVKKYSTSIVITFNTCFSDPVMAICNYLMDKSLDIVVINYTYRKFPKTRKNGNVGKISIEVNKCQNVHALDKLLNFCMFMQFINY